MPKESWSQQAPLNEDEARNEANMIKGKLFADKGAQPNETDKYIRNFGDGSTYEGEFTKEDYEKTSRFIDELKRELEAEPELTKNLYKMGRLFNNTGKVASLPVKLVDEFFRVFAGQFVESSKEDYKNESGWTGFIANGLSVLQKEADKMLLDPAKKTKESQKIGEKYEKTINDTREAA